jgi:hypothetical protein
MAYGLGFGGLAIDRDVFASIVGGVAGAVQTFALRELVDIPQAKTFLAASSSAKPPFLMKALGSFGSPSAIIGIGAGLVGTIIGYMFLKKGKSYMGSFLLSYGIVALSTGILSGVLPTAAWASAVAVDPSNPVRFASKRSNSVSIRPANSVAVPSGNVTGIGTI